MGNMLLSLLLSSYVLLVVSGNPPHQTTFYYSQRVDHFSYGTHLSEMRFTQQYHIDSTFWSGPESSGPILVYFGGEGALHANVIGLVGIISESAPHLGALAIYIEHRFYGQSIPYGSTDRAMDDPDVRGCLTTAQALADFYEIVSGVKRNLSATNSPVIVIGGSYAGILAALYRLKYPDVATGALASSAPMYFDLFHSKDFYSIVSRDFQDINHKCYEKIQQSWQMIDNMAKQPGGLDHLSQTFGFCYPLFAVEELKAVLVNFYAVAAQYNGRFSHFINKVCDNVLDSSNHNNIEGIALAVNATYNNPQCVSISSWGAQNPYSLDQDSAKSWHWQMCTELNIPFHSEEETMFSRQTYNVSDYLANCEGTYGFPVHPWFADSKANDITAILHGFTSNIIFSNGLRDPLSSVGVLEDISGTIVSINTKQGSHCLDVTQAESDDPKWLVHQRQKEMKIFMEWIEKAQHPNSSSPPLKRQLWVIQLVLFLLLCLIKY